MQSKSDSLIHLLWGSSDWHETLLGELVRLKAEDHGAASASEAFALGTLLEHCVSDRKVAIAAYVLCFQRDTNRIDALIRARQLSLELGDFATAARLASFQFSRQADAQLLVVEGSYWLDSGEPDRAVKPLASAYQRFPNSEIVKSALQTARQEWPDVRAEIRRLKGLALSAETGPQAARVLKLAINTLAMLNTSEDVLEKYLLTAFKADPENASVLAMLQERIPTMAYPEAFLAICESRIDIRTGPWERVEELRRTGTCLAQSERFREVGIRVLERALTEAYEEQLVEIPGHLAMHTMLLTHFTQSSLLREYLDLILKGLTNPLPQLDLIFLVLQGLSVSWKKLKDNSLAKHFAEMARDLTPEHPLVVAAFAAPFMGTDASVVSVSTPDESSSGLIEWSEPTQSPREKSGPPVSGIREIQALVYPEGDGYLGTPEEDGLESAATTVRYLDYATEEYEHEGSNRVEMELLDSGDDSFVETLIAEVGDGSVDLPLLEDDLDEDSLDLPMLEGRSVDVAESLDGEAGEIELDSIALTDEELATIQSNAKTDTKLRAVRADARPSFRPASFSYKEGKDPSPNTAVPTKDPGESVSKTSVLKTSAGTTADLDSGWDEIAPKTVGVPPALGNVVNISANAMDVLTQSAQCHKTGGEVHSARSARLRIPVAAQILVGTEEHHASLRDLSETGTFIVTSLKLDLGRELSLKVFLPREKQSLQTLPFLLQMIPNREVDIGFGVEFVQPSEEFLTCLQTLLLEYSVTHVG